MEMDPAWLDSLSEEWISQPRSSSPASHKKSPTPSFNNSQSRIPRLKSRSVSVSSLPTNGSIIAKRSKEGVLRERTASDQNVSLSKLHKPSSKVDNGHISMDSLPSTPKGTVQHRVAQTNGEKQHATPDWRKRVLEEGHEYGGQRDLFSPMGLEHVFKQPSTRMLPRKQRSQKVEVAKVEHFPSSPPPYSKPTRKNSTDHNVYKGRAQDDYVLDAIKTAPLSLQKPSHSDHNLNNLNINSSQHSSPMEEPSRDSQQGSRIISPLTAYQVNSTDHTHHISHCGTLKDQSRTTSNHSELRHEMISPVSLPRHAFSRQTTKSSADLSGNPSKSELPTITNDHPSRPSSRSSDRGTYGRTQHSSRRQEQIMDLTSHSLPDDLSVGTEVFVANGGFVNTRRGGYSADGSFRRRPLSPSLPPSDLLPEDTSLADPSWQLNEGHSSASRLGTREQEVTPPKEIEITPKTPVRNRQQDRNSPDKPRSAGSPLKLFDKYDTFTNDRLLRRMSQFEEGYQEEPSDPKLDCENAESLSTVHQAQSLPRLPTSCPPTGKNHRISSFGEGKLDCFGFTHRALLQGGNGLEDYKNQSPSRPQPHKDQVVLSPQSASSTTMRKSDNSRRCRSKLSSSTRSSRCNQSTIDLGNESADSAIDSTHKLHESPGNEKSGKRFLNSPAKDSKAKRRCMIYVKEDKRLNVNDHLLVETVLPIPAVSIIGRKRKDARYEHDSQAADPEILAKRSILRPRIFTPHHVRSGSGPVAPLTLSPSKAVQIPDVSVVDEQLGSKNLPTQTVDQSTHILAEELATFALDVAQDIATGVRKTSVTTADFFNEANLIMQHIRAKEQFQSNRESGDNSDLEQLENIEESSFEGSTKERLSRPPSREGGSLRRLRERKQLDPRVVSHLRKYEDKSDIDVGLSASTKSFKAVIENTGEVGGPMESDPPNIRMRNNQQRKDSWRQDTRAESSDDQPLSSTSSKGSIPSGSSNSTGHKATIAPQTISHLISDHVAGMTFDRTRQAWVKRKASTIKVENPEDHSSECTEEDPLGEIPDLSVDEVEELNRMKAHLESSPLSSNHTDTVEKSRQSEPPKSKHNEDCTHFSSVGHLNANEEQHHSDPEPAKQSESDIDCLHSTSPTNSKGGQPSLSVGIATHVETDKSPSTKPVECEEDVEREFSILEGRFDPPPIRIKDMSRQPRVVTVAFSSPLVDEIYEKDSFKEPIEDWELDDELDHKFAQDQINLHQISNDVSTQKSSGYMQTSSFRRAGRRASAVTRSYLTRPVSRIDEQEELIFLDDDKVCHTLSRDIVLTTPQQPLSITRHLSVSPGEASDPSFQLTPLPNFSMHQIDEVVDQESKKVSKRRDRLSGELVRRPFDLSVKEIVKKITDIEPYEPYWEHIRKLNLQNKELLTLHELKHFCDRIEELNVSENELSHLNGAPSGIRILNARGNCITSLTDWSHLPNLQYLDISNNHVQDFCGFRGLWHLRDIQADNNQIEDLSGLSGLDGLLRLSLRNNHIKTLNFKCSNL